MIHKILKYFRKMKILNRNYKFSSLPRAISVTKNGPLPGLCLTLAVTAIGQAVLFTMVPVIGETTKIGLRGLSFVVALGILAFVVAAPLWGRSSDRLGPRRVMLRGCAGVTLGQGGFALTIELAAQGYIGPEVTLYLMILFRVIHGAAAAALFPVAQAWVAGVYDERERLSKFGTLRLAMTFGRLAGPALAAVLTLIAPLAPIHALALFALLAFWAMSSCPECQTAKPEPREKTVSVPPAPTASLALPLLLAVVVLLAVMNGQLQFAIGLHAQTRLGFDAVQASQFVGGLMTLAALAAVLVQVFLLRRLDGRAFLTLSVAGLLASCAVALVYWGGNWWLFALAGLFVGASLAMAFPACAALLTAVHDRDRLGRAMGAFGSAQTTGYALGAALGGLYEAWPALSFGVSFCAPLIAVALASRFIPLPRRLPDPKDRASREEFG